MRVRFCPTTNVDRGWEESGDFLDTAVAKLVQFIDTEEDSEQVVLYVSEAQDRIDRGK